MALWVNEQLLAMRDFEVKFYINRTERNDPRVDVLSDELLTSFITAAGGLFGVRLHRDHVVKTETTVDEKTYCWTYSWQPTTGAAYLPQYDREVTLKTMANSLPKGLIKLRVTDELKLTMEDDSRRDRCFELSSWDDTNNRWIYREVEYQ
jgi:hypothetical protein